MRLGYQALLHLAVLPGALLWGGAALFRPRWRAGWRERLGSWAEVPAGCVWVHGASMGEIRAAAPLIRALAARGKGPVLVTATSPSGRAEAEKVLAGKGAARLLPVDFSWAVGRVFRHVRPSALIVVETEIWPELLYRARREGVPVGLASARISDRSFPRYKRFRHVVGPFLRGYDFIHAQTARDAERFKALGADPGRVRLGGNLKFDVPAADPADPDAQALGALREAGWKVLVAGSTHEGEERAVLEAARRVREAGMKIAVVLAPRHLERIEGAERAAREAGFPPVRWSTLPAPRAEGLREAFEAGRTVVVDGYGLLGRLYGGADAAFVGGSLVPVGGHNLLEPLNWGVPVFFGPHMQNGADIRDEVAARGLGREVADGEGLGAALLELFADPARASSIGEEARAFLDANRGAVNRALEALDGLPAVGGGNR
jgi:3-deoxy-D-manno-octulosonic-acid transferase